MIRGATLRYLFPGVWAGEGGGGVEGGEGVRRHFSDADIGISPEICRESSLSPQDQFWIDPESMLASIWHRSSLDLASIRHQAGIDPASIQHRSSIDLRHRSGIDPGSIWHRYRRHQRSSGTLPGPSGMHKTMKNQQQIRKITNFNFSDWVLKLSTNRIDW